MIGNHATRSLGRKENPVPNTLIFRKQLPSTLFTLWLPMGSGYLKTVLRKFLEHLLDLVKVE